MCIFLVFCILFFVLIILRIQVTDAYFLQSEIKNSISQPKYYFDRANLTFVDTNTNQRVAKFFTEVLCKYFENDIINTHNYFVNVNKARITFNRYDFESNSNPLSKEAIKYVIFDDRKYNTTNFRGHSSLRKYRYLEPGTFKTFKKQGGYVINLNEHSDISIPLNDLFLDNIVDADTKNIVVEWVLYNPNMNLFTYNYIEFIKYISGGIMPSIYSKAINLDVYEQGSSVLILNLIFFVFTLYYTFRVMRS